MKTTQTYDDLEQTLASIDALTEAAETHGLICGFVCGGSGEKDRLWQTSILGDHTDAEENAADLANLQATYDEAYQKLYHFSMEFHLLLPNDEMALHIRLHALGQWCHGFITGIALTKADPKTNEEANEALKDLQEIAKLDNEFDEEDENNETYFMELVEHVRISALLLHSLLNTPTTKH